ncbi:glutathione hydrolase 3 isoform X1 [Beta vulgaris subsp. vulgaris]|uniref:glutathione hydrolase 3 isoform X1 n=2 Tax=Beta vulgaris subsp. vulgaris TaxID=3555 RepID=UPI00203689C1|nr:glutathione hydrolase 3 isoform X1 [Beta vulgaris subsp. vulgaris]
MENVGSTESPLLGNHKKSKVISWGKAVFSLLALLTITGLAFGSRKTSWFVTTEQRFNGKAQFDNPEIVESDRGVVAADDGRCSNVGVFMLRQGGHAVDAAVATALCVGVVNPMASGIGGGAFMVVRSASTSEALAFDMRETAPSSASENMYKNDPGAKNLGPLSMGVPGELAGLHEAWKKYGRLSWRILFQPSIQLAKNGFEVLPYLGNDILKHEEKIKADPGLREVFAPNGRLLQTGDICYNVKLADSLQAIAEHGPQAFYNGMVGEKLVRDVREAGGILTMEDLRNYKVKVTDALAVDVMGFELLGMPPPSSGTLGIAMILNILNKYGSANAIKGSLGLHRLIEAMKHMFAIRMNLGDPAFVNVTKYMSDMTSPSFAEEIWHKIYDNTTFPPEYYLSRWSQLQDHGTSHFCIVDAERNAVSVTTTVNYPFGGGVLSPSTGIVLNDEMDDFSTPTEVSPDNLPPAPANFIQPGKRPLSSMTPLVILKDDQLAGVIGGSGGMKIIPAVVQVFLNHFVQGMDPLTAVQSPRVYHELIPNVVSYENVTVIDGEHIELSQEKMAFLEEKGHQLKRIGIGAICQLIVQTFENPVDLGRKTRKNHIGNANIGTLIAVSDPRKDGRPAGI